MFSPELIFLFAAVTGVAIATINIAFAIGVFVDYARMVEDGSRQTKIVPGPMWAFATLFGGVFVATAYWFIHHSKLSYRD